VTPPASSQSLSGAKDGVPIVLLPRVPSVGTVAAWAISRPSPTSALRS